ncbi:uncharacterized protein [Montipora foliosa]|uniref:uncharacterized protein n=1 Tax=Montipora foliosa TaxID=591990 RepID=UPI0035F14C19
MKKIVARWKCLVIILIGATSLFLCQLSSFNVFREWTEWNQQTADYCTSTVCGNDTERSILSNHKHIINHGLVNKETFTGSQPTTKALAKHERKQGNYLRKINRRRKVHTLPGDSIKRTNNESDKSINKRNFFDFWRSDKFDMMKFEDINISEETDFSEFISVSKNIPEKTLPAVPTEASRLITASSYGERSSTGRKRFKKYTDVKPIPTPPTPGAAFEKSSQVYASPKTEKEDHLIYSGPILDARLPYCVVGSFLGTVVVRVSALVLKSIRTYVKSRRNRRKRHIPSFTYPEHQQIEVHTDCNLAQLPLNLQEILMKKLDVRCKGRYYGWQKVGAAFKVDIDDMRYLELEYKKDNGSPTLRLLELLGIERNKTISDLVILLKSSKIKRFDITSKIKLTKRK